MIVDNVNSSIYVEEYKDKKSLSQSEFSTMEYENVPEEEKILGIGFLREKNSNYAFGMCAKYAEEFSINNPVIKVIVTKGGNTEEYDINVKKINPANATEMEMFALCSYADSIGQGIGGSFGSWQALKYYSLNANHLGNFEMSDTIGQFSTLNYNWTEMVSYMIGEYMNSGIYKQVIDGNKLLDIFKLFE